MAIFFHKISKPITLHLLSQGIAVILLNFLFIK